MARASSPRASAGCGDTACCGRWRSSSGSRTGRSMIYDVDVRAVRPGGARRRTAAVHRDRLRWRDRRRHRRCGGRPGHAAARRRHVPVAHARRDGRRQRAHRVVVALGAGARAVHDHDAARDPLERDHRQPAAVDHPVPPAGARQQRVPILRLGDDADRRRDRRPDGPRGRHVRIARLGAADDVARVRRDPRLALHVGTCVPSPPNGSKRRGPKPRSALRLPATPRRDRVAGEAAGAATEIHSTVTRRRRRSALPGAPASRRSPSRTTRSAYTIATPITIARVPTSTSTHGWTAAKTTNAITTRSTTRWTRRPTRRNALSGPIVTAALSSTTPPTTAGTSGSGPWSPVATRIRPMMYSTSWCSQNGRIARSDIRFKLRHRSPRDGNDRTGNEHDPGSVRTRGRRGRLVQPLRPCGYSVIFSVFFSITSFRACHPCHPCRRRRRRRSAARACRPRGTRW